MVSGYVDWHKRTYTDIIAQSIEKILVDVGAVSVDELPVNIKAQDIDKMNIDITAQTVERLFIAYSYGATQSVRASGNISPGETLSAVTINARAVLLGGFLRFFGGSDVKKLFVYAKIDGSVIDGFSLQSFNNYNIANPSGWLYFLIKNGSSDNDWALSISKGITFDESYELRLYLPSDATLEQYYDVTILYAVR